MADYKKKYRRNRRDFFTISPNKAFVMIATLQRAIKTKELINRKAGASRPTCKRANQKPRTANASTGLASGSWKSRLKITYLQKTYLKAHYRRCRLLAYEILNWGISDYIPQVILPSFQT